jgi:hypothetical protein
MNAVYRQRHCDRDPSDCSQHAYRPGPVALSELPRDNRRQDHDTDLRSNSYRSPPVRANRMDDKALAVSQRRAILRLFDAINSVHIPEFLIGNESTEY